MHADDTGDESRRIDDSDLLRSATDLGETMVSTDGAASGDASGGPPPAGTTIGRYVVLGTLGAGAMGVVVAAYDPELDRRVALKLLRPRPGRDEAAARSRLQREAQALAKLNHTNVVAVHDVGLHEGQVFIAMEFVAGETLAAWMKPANNSEPRPWREVLAVFMAAGRGLAAAHSGGLIHRDFKPDNVMLDGDGRVRVMDFGLARGESNETSARHPDRSRSTDHGASTPADDDDDGARSILDTPLTQTGALLGTPAYMSPEQFAGMEVTARSDQFAFFVALFEALYGARPFQGDSLANLMLAVSDGEITTPRGRSVPRWLDGMLRRGLSPHPDERFPDMDAVLTGLARGETRRRGRLALAGIGVAGLIAAGGLGQQRWERARLTRACADMANSVDTVWSDPARAALRTAFVEAGAADAEVSADAVVPYFDAHADAIRMAQRDACLDTRVREVSSEEELDRATWCLDERRDRLGALAAEFTRADASSIHKAVSAVSQLPSRTSCRDPAHLRGLPPSMADRERIRAVRKDLARAEALEWAGRYPEGLIVAREALDQALDIGWQDLSASAHWRLGASLASAGEYSDAEPMIVDAYFMATDVNLHSLRALAATRLVSLLGFRLSRPDEAMIWARHANSALTALDEPEDGLRRADLASDMASAHSMAGAYDEATALYERAASITERRLGARHPLMGPPLHGLANAYSQTGNFEKSIEYNLRALDVYRRAFGPRHPVVASNLSTLANARSRNGEHEASIPLLEEAIAILEAALGPDHPNVAAALSNLGSSYAFLARPDDAAPLYARALAIEVPAMGPLHQTTMYTRYNLASSLRDSGKPGEAARLLEEAVALQEAAGKKPGEVAQSLNFLASTHEQMGEHARANEAYRRILPVWLDDLGDGHPGIAFTYENIARTYEAMGQPSLATEPRRKAAAIIERHFGPPDPRIAPTEIGLLGNVITELGRYERALRIVEKALGEDHPNTAYPRLGIASILLRSDTPGDAIVPARKALATWTGPQPGPPELVAECRFVLARALWEAAPANGRDRGAALTEARAALDAYRRADDTDDSIPSVERWIEEHSH